MSRTQGIRIDDLAAPQYPVAARHIFELVGEAPVEISVAAIYCAAEQQLGEIELYRDDGLVERLAVVADALNADTDLSAFGRMTIHTILTRYLVQRCRLEELYRRHPEIEAVQIERPIIIAGLPRSGTTHMLNLISVDDRLRSLRYWESLEPVPLVAEQHLAAGEEDPRIQRCRDQLELQDQMMPLFKNMHEMSPGHIHEEVELMGMDFSMALFDTYALVPAWRDYYLCHDQTPHYQFLKRALQALQWLRGPQRWILKSPQHMEQLRPLHTVFPDATFVLPHRDPVSVITSMLTMQAYVGRMSRNPVRPRQIGDYWVDRITRMLRQCVADRDRLPSKQTLDVRFDDFMADDVGTIERIYAVAGLPLTAVVRAAMELYRVDNPRGKHGRIAYDLRQDFGIDAARLRKQLGFYYEKFPLQVEV